MFHKLFFLSFIWFTFSYSFSQEEKGMHSPQKALILSAFLPGSGQVYNRQYWKAPLYIGGLVATGYLAYTNYQYYKDYKKAYLARTDNDSLTMDPFPYYSEQNLLDIMSFYRRNTELSIIGFSLFYALNILDAYVYAHFFDFSIQIDDVRKISIYPVINTKAKGLMLRFCF